MVAHVVLGKQSDGVFGLRCSTTSYDASSNPVDETQLSFSSDWNTVLPIYLSGTSLNIANNATQTISFASLGYIPWGFFMFRKNGVTTPWLSLPALYNHGTVIILVGTYIDHVKVINKIGYAIDIAYSLFYTVTQ